MKENIALEKSFDFALQVIQVYLYLVQEKKEYVLSKQLLKSGTSVGANLEEAAGAQSRADFVAKVHIALKEARETDYWIRLIRDSNLLDKNRAENLRDECIVIIKILTKTLITCKNSPNY